MIEEKDVWRAANLLIARFGEAAVAVAQRKVDEMDSIGDRDLSVVWGSVVVAVRALVNERGGGTLQ